MLLNQFRLFCYHFPDTVRRLIFKNILPFFYNFILTFKIICDIIHIKKKTNRFLWRYIYEKTNLCCYRMVIAAYLQPGLLYFFRLIHFYKCYLYFSNDNFQYHANEKKQKIRERAILSIISPVSIFILHFTP